MVFVIAGVDPADIVKNEKHFVLIRSWFCRGDIILIILISPLKNFRVHLIVSSELSVFLSNAQS